MLLPFLAFILAARGEVRIGGEERSLRIFLVQEEEAQGVGISWERPLRDQTGCNKTRVTYLMWAGQAQNTAYCLCPNTGVIPCPP